MNTLPALLAGAAERSDLLVGGGHRWATSAVAEGVARLAGGLAARGVRPGDTVAFQFPTRPDGVLLYRACWHLAAVPAALHPRAGSAELETALGSLAPALVVAAARTALADRPGTLVVGEEPATPLDEAEPVPPRPVDPDHRAVVLFTSGSTGTPRGVVHRHGGLAYKVRQLIDVHGLAADDVVLMPAPLAHVTGLLHGVLVAGAAGMKAVLMERWDAGRALELIETEGVTTMVGPPTFFLGLMGHGDFHPDRTASLRLLSCGGTGVTPAFVARAEATLGCRVKRSYGATEAPTVTTSRHDDDPDRMATTDGRAFDATELRVEGPPGEVGELWVRGPEVAVGYLDADQTTEAFVDGWFRTGDLARLEDGWLTITGRLGDRIIRGGENIAGGEVERILEDHPAVRHAVVVAAPDAEMGERVAAFVVVDEGLRVPFDLQACRAWFAERGAGRLLWPERVEVVGDLPLLASGKPDRAALVRRMADETVATP